MRVQLAALMAAVALSASAGPASVAAQDREEFFWSGRVAPGRAVEVRSINGAIRAERANGTEVEITAVKTARRSDPSEVTVEIVEHADGLLVCAVYPTPTGSRPNECSTDNYSMSTRNNDVQVEFTLRIPDGVRLDARTTNGGVEASGLTADVDVRTTNGGIRISTLGVARARTTNGAIDVTLGDLSGTDPLEFRTTNGGITLTVPGGLDANLSARTTNGSISSDLPITVQGSFGPRRLEGVIGSGGRSIVLETTNGNVRLRTSGS